MNLADLQRLVHLDGKPHEIAVVLQRAEAAPEFAKQLGAQLNKRPVLVRAWNQIRPDLEKMMVLNDVSTGLMVFIIFIVATLGVINTMLMAVFERTREFGVLKAIGMSGYRIVTLVVTETVVLVLAASAVGTLLGLGLDLYMVHYGVDLREMTVG